MVKNLQRYVVTAYFVWEPLQIILIKGYKRRAYADKIFNYIFYFYGTVN